jgi:hypothetical protein
MEFLDSRDEATAPTVETVWNVSLHGNLWGER